MLWGPRKVIQADWVSGNKSGTWDPVTGARGGDEVLGMRPKPSYQNWDTFHVGPVFFTSFLQKSWKRVCLPLGPGRAYQVRGAQVGLGEALA